MSTATGSILIVDDEASNRDLFARYVKRAGYSHLLAEDGFQALEAVEENRPDLILLDWMMPELSGIDVLRSIRESYDANTLPIIMCTALDDSEYVAAALNEGANDFVNKPVNPVVLKARITTQMERKTSAESRAELTERLENVVAERTRTLARFSELMQSNWKLGGDDLNILRELLLKVAAPQPELSLDDAQHANRLLGMLPMDIDEQDQDNAIAI